MISGPTRLLIRSADRRRRGSVDVPGSHSHRL